MQPACPSRRTTKQTALCRGGPPAIASLTSMLAMVFLCLCATPASLVAAPTPEPSSPLVADARPTVDSAIALIRGFYRQTAVTERLRITVRTPSQPERRSTVLVRTDPVARSAWIKAGRLLIQIDPLRAWISTDRADPLWLEAPIVPPIRSTTLEGVLPALPIPALDLWVADDVERGTTMPSLTPYARGVRWEGVTTDPRTGAVTLAGASLTGRTTLLADGKSGQVRRLTISLDRPGSAEIVIDATTAGPSAALFEVTLVEAQRAASIEQLLGTTTDSVAGSRLDLSSFFDLEGRSVSQPKPGAPATSFQLLVLVRSAPSHATSIDAALAIVREALAAPANIETARLVVIAPADAQPIDAAIDEQTIAAVQATLDRHPRALAPVTGQPAGIAIGAPWWTGAGEALDALIPPDSQVACVIIDQTAMVRSAIALDPMLPSTEQFRADLVIALTGTGPAAAPKP